MPKKKSSRYKPEDKAEALEVVITENQVQSFLHKINKNAEFERFTTEITLFEFWKYIQEKRDRLDPWLFED